MPFGHLLTMHISVGAFRKEISGRADFDKEKSIEFNDVIYFRENHSGLLGKNPITGLRIKGQYNSKAFHRILLFATS
jgi:hypothetical protein